MNYLDLFHGIGGFAYGAYLAGMKFEKHYCSDIERYVVDLYAKRFPDSIQLGDITKIKTNEFPAGDWIISGGFPCQDISIAGKGKGLINENGEYTRSGLWFEYWRIIRDLRPRFAIMENVGELTNNGLDTVLGTLAEIGYNAEWQDIRASDIGAAHRRERIWIVAHPNSIKYVKGSREKTILQKQRLQGEFVGSNQDLRTRSNLPASRFCRTSHDVPYQVDRLRGLGNAIVPQIAQLLFEQIKELL